MSPINIKLCGYLGPTPCYLNGLFCYNLMGIVANDNNFRCLATNQRYVVSVSSPKRIFGVGAWNVNCTSSNVHVFFVPQCQISVPLIKVIPRFNLCVILRRNNDTRTHNQNQFRNRRVLINSIFHDGSFDFHPPQQLPVVLDRLGESSLDHQNKNFVELQSSSAK